MIHILKWILKLIAMAIFACTIGFGSILVSLLLWNRFFIEETNNMYEYLLENY